MEGGRRARAHRESSDHVRVLVLVLLANAVTIAAVLCFLESMHIVASVVWRLTRLVGRASTAAAHTAAATSRTGIPACW